MEVRKDGVVPVEGIREHDHPELLQSLVGPRHDRVMLDRLDDRPDRVSLALDTL